MRTTGRPRSSLAVQQGHVFRNCLYAMADADCLLQQESLEQDVQNWGLLHPQVPVLAHIPEVPHNLREVPPLHVLRVGGSHRAHHFRGDWTGRPAATT